MSIVSGNMVFYYMARENLCFLTLCEEKYPKRMAFMYLEEISDLILQELLREHGNNVRIHPPIRVVRPGTIALTCRYCICIGNCYFVLQWRTQVDQASRPFQFIHYDPVIQRKQREYIDQRPGQGKSQLNEDLNDIQSIMRKNIDEILNRGEKLDHVQSISQDLKSKSKDFKWGTKKLTWQAKMQQYGPMAIGAFIVILVLYIKIFHIGF